MVQVAVAWAADACTDARALAKEVWTKCVSVG